MTSDCVYSARPSAPKELKFDDITKDSVHLTWEPPDDDGGSPLTGYLVEKREVSRKTWTKVSFEQRCTNFRKKKKEGKSQNSVKLMFLPFSTKKVPKTFLNALMLMLPRVVQPSLTEFSTKTV